MDITQPETLSHNGVELQSRNRRHIDFVTMRSWLAVLPDHCIAKIKSILCEAGDTHVITLKAAFSSFDDLRELKEAVAPVARTTPNSGISFYVDGADHGLSHGFTGDHPELPYLDCWIGEEGQQEL